MEEKLLEEDNMASEETKIIRELSPHDSDSVRTYVSLMAAQKRSDEQKASDLGFLRAYRDSCVPAAKMPAKPITYLQHHPGGIFTAWVDDRFVSVDLPRGYYTTKNLGKDLRDGKAVVPFAWDGPLFSCGQYLAADDRAAMRLLLTKDGQYIALSGQQQQTIPFSYGGLVYAVENGLFVLKGTATTAEFESLYPAIASHGLALGYYTSVLAKETSPMWDQAPAVLEDFRNRTKLLPHCEIHAVVPSWVRTWGWDGQGNGKLKREFYRKVAAPYHPSVGTLLRDELGWRVHFSLGGELIGGVAFFTTPEKGARLLISDWCYRETPEGLHEQEMYHGLHNPLDIFSWIAGPATDKFLGQRSVKYKLVRPFKTDYSEAWLALWAILVDTIETATVATNIAEVEAVLAARPGKAVAFSRGDKSRGTQSLLGEITAIRDRPGYGVECLLQRYATDAVPNHIYNNNSWWSGLKFPILFVDPTIASMFIQEKA